MIFKNNKVFDVLKIIDMLVLPALTTLYVELAKVWGFPYAQKIAETSTAVCAFLGAILSYSNAQYYKMISESDSAKYFMDFDEELEGKEEGEG